MKIKMRTRASGPDPTKNWAPGDELEMDDNLAQALIDAGYAESLEKKKKSRKPEVETAAIEPEVEKAEAPSGKGRGRKGS